MVWNYLFGTDEKKNFDPQLLQSIEQKNNNYVESTLQTDKTLCTTIDLLDTSLLHYAAEYGNEIITEFLIKSGAKVNLQNAKGQTPLILATKMNHEETIQVLLKHNADIYLIDNDNINALQLAVQQVLPKIISIFLAELQKLNSSYEIARKLFKANCPLYVAVSLQDIHVVSNMLLSGRSIDETDSQNKQTALHIAVKNGNAKMVKILVDRGANVNAVDVHGRTPFYFVQNCEILKYLVSKGKLTLCTEDGVMQMYCVLVNGALEDVKVVLESGVDLQARDLHGWTAIHYLTKNVNEGIVGLLSEIVDKVNSTNADELQTVVTNSKEIDWNTKDKYGRTILHNAMVAGNVEFVKYLIEKGVDVNVKSTDGSTPLFEALITSESSLKQRVDCVKLIIEGGALPDVEIERYFEIYKTNEPEFSLLEPVIAHLVLREAKGEMISGKIFESINCYPKLKDLVVSCREELDRMKKETFHISTYRCETLFNFLTESVDKFVYAYDDQLDKIVKKYKCNSNYSGILQKRYEVFSKTDPGISMYSLAIPMFLNVGIGLLIPYCVSGYSKLQLEIESCTNRERIFGVSINNFIRIVTLVFIALSVWGASKVTDYFEDRWISRFSGWKSITRTS